MPVVVVPGHRRRRFCSDACRKRAHRDRVEAVVLVASADPVDGDAVRALTVEAVDRVLAGSAPADPVDQLCRAVSETESLAVEFGRLAGSTPRGLGWRSGEMSSHLRAGLDRLFPREGSA